MHRIIAIFVILLGVNFLLDNFDLPKIDLGVLKKLWPLALIWLGWTIWRDDDRKKH